MTKPIKVSMFMRVLVQTIKIMDSYDHLKNCDHIDSITQKQWR